MNDLHNYNTVSNLQQWKQTVLQIDLKVTLAIFFLLWTDLPWKHLQSRVSQGIWSCFYIHYWKYVITRCLHSNGWFKARRKIKIYHTCVSLQENSWGNNDEQMKFTDEWVFMFWVNSEIGRLECMTTSMAHSDNMDALQIIAARGVHWFTQNRIFQFYLICLSQMELEK